MLVAAHRLDHRPARLLALAAGLRTRPDLGRVQLVALGRTRLARLGTRGTGVGHERALVRDEVGREVAELPAVGHEVQGLREEIRRRQDDTRSTIERMFSELSNVKTDRNLLAGLFVEIAKCLNQDVSPKVANGNGG